jgi:septal ring factor EnvC (AmiA/AmiB activator)
MKTKKFNLNWQSVLLGMVLCMVLVVFMGSKAADPQSGTVPQQQVLQRAANVTDVWDKTIALEAQLYRMEQKIDGLVDELHRVYNTVRLMDQQLGKKN